MIKTILTFALWLGVIFVSAQSEGEGFYSFSGKLVDIETGSPIVNAAVSVEINDSTYSTISDILGEFVLSLPSKPTNFNVQSLFFQGDDLGINQKGVYTLKSKIVNVPESVVVIYADNTRQTATSPIAVLSPTDFNSADNSSLQEALNTVPGVKMDSRGYGGSRRINIRGSFIRSPFAVRNIKIYLDGFPLTSPDGQAALELLDDFDLRSLQIIKGPNGSAYGAGNGGVINASSKQPILGSSAETRFTLGSFGYYKTASSASFANDKFDVRVSYLQQHTDGYREQEFNDRQQLSLTANYKLSSRLIYSLWANDYSGTWGLPGALNGIQVRLNPRQALPIALSNNARVDRDRSRIGIKQEFTSRYFKNETAVYYNTTTKINPFASSAFFNGYKDEAAAGYGARNVMTYRFTEKNGWKIDLRNVLEFTYEDNELSEFDILFGAPGDLRYINQTASTEFVANLGVNAVRNEKLTLEAGLAYSQKDITSENQTGPFNDALSQNISRTFSGLLPYAGASFKILESLTAFGSVSLGYSPPSVFELLEPNTGVLSDDLSPETAQNFEIGIRRMSFKKRSIQFELNAYLMQIDNGIFQYEDQEGIVRFGNRQGLAYQGIEGSLSRVFKLENTSAIDEISLQFTGTVQDYRLKNAENPEQENNQVAGVPLASASGEIKVRLAYGFEVRAQHQWYDRTPLNDDNSLYYKPYHLLNIRAGWDLSSIKQNSTWTLEVFGGMQNVLGTQYTSFLALNAFGGRYYNPMPEETFFGGIKIGKRF